MMEMRGVEFGKAWCFLWQLFYVDISSMTCFLILFAGIIVQSCANRERLLTVMCALRNSSMVNNPE